MTKQPAKILLNGKEIISDAAIAVSLSSRIRGLLGTTQLKNSEGLIINDCRQVHTFFMRYAIDVVFLSSQDEVVKVSTLPPWRISTWVRRAKRVLEIPAGAAKKHGFTNGAKLEVRT